METESDKLNQEIGQEAIDFAKAGGHELIELPPEDLNKFFSFLEEVALEKAAKLDAQGLPGTEIFQETRHLAEKYG
jgi:hypothetical protein